MAAYEVLRDERTEEKEDRAGRIRSRRWVIWVVVRYGEAYREFRTRKEALAHAKMLNDAIPRSDGRKTVTAVRCPR